MELVAGYEEPSMQFCGPNSDVDSGETCTWDEMKSIGQDSDESKMSLEDEDSLPFNLTMGVDNSSNVAKLCDEGDAKSEVSEAGIDKNCNISLKRLHNEVSEEYSVSLDLKRKKNVPGSPDDEFVSVVADSEGGNMRNDDDVMLLDPDIYRKEVHRPNRNKEPSCRMLDWLTGVARDPCHPAVNSLPEKSKWKSHGNEEFWKQVLLVREAISLKKHDDVATQPPNWQVYEVTVVISLFFLLRECVPRDFPTFACVNACPRHHSLHISIPSLTNINICTSNCYMALC